MRVIDIPEKTRRLTASSGTIPTCGNPANRPGIEPGSPWWEASKVTAQPPWPRRTCGYVLSSSLQCVDSCDEPKENSLELSGLVNVVAMEQAPQRLNLAFTQMGPRLKYDRFAVPRDILSSNDVLAKLHSRASNVCSLAVTPVLPHTWQYGIRFLFPCKPAIGSESSRACIRHQTQDGHLTKRQQPLASLSPERIAWGHRDVGARSLAPLSRAASGVGGRAPLLPGGRGGHRSPQLRLAVTDERGAVAGSSRQLDPRRRVLVCDSPRGRSPFRSRGLCSPLLRSGSSQRQFLSGVEPGPASLAVLSVKISGAALRRWLDQNGREPPGLAQHIATGEGRMQPARCPEVNSAGPPQSGRSVVNREVPLIDLVRPAVVSIITRSADGPSHTHCRVRQDLITRARAHAYKPFTQNCSTKLAGHLAITKKPMSISNASFGIEAVMIRWVIAKRQGRIRGNNLVPRCVNTFNTIVLRHECECHSVIAVTWNCSQLNVSAAGILVKHPRGGRATPARTSRPPPGTRCYSAGRLGRQQLHVRPPGMAASTFASAWDGNAYLCDRMGWQRLPERPPGMAEDTSAAWGRSNHLCDRLDRQWLNPRQARLMRMEASKCVTAWDGSYQTSDHLRDQCAGMRPPEMVMGRILTAWIGNKQDFSNLGFTDFTPADHFSRLALLLSLVVYRLYSSIKQLPARRSDAPCIAAGLDLEGSPQPEYLKDTRYPMSGAACALLGITGTLCKHSFVKKPPRLQLQLIASRNARAGETVDPRENPPGVTSQGIEPGSTRWEASRLTTLPTAAPHV
ncbi:hypothetical protein PR048_024475 [Dryococelus australis]|uniref:Uncharacterized protein n=1 Tax=Dryococelus australis TaxID=614101 RepID=A0ABQ9GNP3_9NEOP|nr:hypothetical protein PR048_024475 [Dryococelus australis]